MVGGIVVDVIWHDDRIVVDCADCVNSGRGAISLVRNADSEAICWGDSLWWQGRTAYWTPKGARQAADTPIPRTSLGGVKVRGYEPQVKT